MSIHRNHWLGFIFLSLVSIAVWFKFTYPQLSFMNLSVDRAQALAIAEDYLRKNDLADPALYKKAVNFFVDEATDQYLQKALGFEGEQKFFKEHGVELFSWTVRFFQENEKEQYYVTLSAATGEVLEFSHIIKDTDPRPFQSEEAARQKAVRFLQTRSGFEPDLYILHKSSSQKYENRNDYFFSWEKRDVFIKWNDTKDSGGAKLLISAKVSGEDILSFSKITLEIPDGFFRYLARQKDVGKNLSVLFRFFSFTLFVLAIFFVVTRRNHLVMHAMKAPCLTTAGVLFVLSLLNYFNNFEGVLYHYPTVSAWASYLWQNISASVIGIFLVIMTVTLPMLAGETLRYEAFPKKKESSFLHYVNSTYLSRDVSKAVLLGYLAAVIMLGIQSAVFALGQRFLGVWVEYSWLTHLSSTYIPALAAFLIGAIAGLSEEIVFRLFAVNLGKKFLKNTLLAVLFSSILWGYSHSMYLVFPMWFRGMEVTLLGLFLSFIYLRFGIIPVVIAHYLFDAFLHGSVYFWGQSTTGLFYGSLGVLGLPAIFALVAYLRNKPVFERPLRWRLTTHQIYNLKILEHFLETRGALNAKSLEGLKNEIMSHGWDMAVVEAAMENLKKKAGR